MGSEDFTSFIKERRLPNQLPPGLRQTFVLPFKECALIVRQLYFSWTRPSDLLCACIGRDTQATCGLNLLMNLTRVMPKEAAVIVSTMLVCLVGSALELAFFSSPCCDRRHGLLAKRVASCLFFFLVARQRTSLGLPLAMNLLDHNPNCFLISVSDSGI